jgi:hypothetical protein
LGDGALLATLLVALLAALLAALLPFRDAAFDFDIPQLNVSSSSAAAGSAGTDSGAPELDGGSTTTGAGSPSTVAGSATRGSLCGKGLGDGTRVGGFVGTRDATFGVDIVGGSVGNVTGSVGIVNCPGGASAGGQAWVGEPAPNAWSLGVATAEGPLGVPLGRGDAVVVGTLDTALGVPVGLGDVAAALSALGVLGGELR